MVTDNQSLQELDFQKVISQLASFAICKSAQNKIFTLQPSGKYNEVLEALETVQEKLYIKNKGHNSMHEYITHMNIYTYIYTLYIYIYRYIVD
jgi:dsDNA-specific endonuclease/ATPase MutS2